MKIFLIERDGCNWDEFMAHVIAAKDEKQCVELAKKEALNSEENSTVWEKAKITYLGTYRGENKEPFVILSDFKAG